MLNWAGGLVLLTIFLVLVALVCNIYTPEVVLLAALIILWNIGIVTTQEALSGFSNSGLITVAALLIVARGIDKSRMLKVLSARVLGASTHLKRALVRLMLGTSFLSAFFNNTPLVALLVPVTRDWSRGQGVAPSKFLMPLSYAAIVGGGLTMIGTSTNLVIQGLLRHYGREEFGFFEPFPMGIIMVVWTILYMVVIGQRNLPSSGGLLRVARDQAMEVLTEVLVLPNFKYLYHSIHAVLKNRLNVSPESLVKIRRRRDAVNTTPKLAPRDLPSVSRNVDGNETNGHVLTDIEENAPETPSEVNHSGLTITAARATELQAELAKHVTSARSQEIEQELTNADDYYDIMPVPQDAVLTEGDIIFLSCPQHLLADMRKTRGLKILDSNILHLPDAGTELYELILSPSNPFLDHDLRKSKFAEFYECQIIAYRRREDAYKMGRESRRSFDGTDPSQDLPSPPNPRRKSQIYPETKARTSSPRSSSCSSSFSSSSGAAAGVDESPSANAQKQHLRMGDTVLVLAKKDSDKRYSKADFLLVTKVGELAPKVRAWDYVPIPMFIVMMLLVIAEVIAMDQASVTLAVLTIAGGWVPAKGATDYLDIPLLVCIASALGLSTAIQASGVAETLGQGIADLDTSPQVALLLVYIFCWICSELVTNNAAAAISLPLALSIADGLGVSFKPFAMAVLFAASTSFCTPYGYATNLMIWSPGGYRFIDYVKIGFPLAITHVILVSFLIPVIWPFE